MKKIGIKLADGTFYPVLDEGEVKTRRLELSTAKDNQTKVQIDLYRSETGTMEDAEYLDTLEITNLNPQLIADTSLNLSVGLDENNELTAAVVDSETGEKSEVQVQLVNRTLAEREATQDASESVLLTDEKLFDIPDFGDLDTEPGKIDEPLEGFDETVPAADETAVEPAAESSTEQTSVETSVEENTFDDSALTTVAADPTEDVPNPTDEFAQETVSDASFDLPDFEDNTFGETKTETTDTVTADSTSQLNEEDFSLPDFDEGSSTDSFDASSSEPQAEGISGFLDDSTFDDPIFDADNNSSSFDEDPFADTPSPAASKNPTGSAMDFSDLYDKETIAGKHSDYDYGEDEDDTRKKTRVPVIICVVCAIICIIATLLVLFFIPSKYNLLGKRSSTQTTEVIEEIEVSPVAKLPETVPAPVKEPEPEPEPIAPAVEDKVVVAPTPEIVPATPAPAKPQKKADIIYRIKWGDTLWDISQAYYKTPWKYPKIAKYNKIKNPDLIISGTDLKIEQE